MSDDNENKEFWWEGLNDTWSRDRVTYLTAGENVDTTEEKHFLGDFIFHRFFGTDSDDARTVRAVLVEVEKWHEWTQWLKQHTASNSILPLYVHPLEQVIMTKKSFRITRWVDEYRPFDLFPYE